MAFAGQPLLHRCSKKKLHSLSQTLGLQSMHLGSEPASKYMSSVVGSIKANMHRHSSFILPVLLADLNLARKQNSSA